MFAKGGLSHQTGTAPQDKRCAFTRAGCRPAIVRSLIQREFSWVT